MKRKQNETRKQQAHPKAGATYHPRSLYRGLGVEYSNKPGRKRIHPKQQRKEFERIMDAIEDRR